MRYSAFSYVVAEKAALYRAVMAVFAEAKAHFIVHLRPEDVQERLAGDTPLDGITAALGQLVNWGNLQAEPDTSRVTTVEEFYRARYLYQITRQGEAAERALRTFDEELGRRGALQTVALEDIRLRLRSLLEQAVAVEPDAMQVHYLLRDLAQVFGDLAENARAFMTGLGRTLELRGADRDAFIAYKERLVGYIERFIGDLVTTSAEIATLIQRLDAPGEHGRPIERLLVLVGEREVADAAPDPEQADAESHARAAAQARWAGHWDGLKAWFLGSAERPSQSALLRARARRAVSQLLEAVMRLNERRLGRSDRSADFRALARWFLECEDDADAHRLWRAAFGLTPARHLSVDTATLERWAEAPVPASTPWREAPPLAVSPRLRATGSYRKPGAAPRLQRRDRERSYLARLLAEEAMEVRAARRRLASGGRRRLSELGELDPNAFRLFLGLLGEALAAARGEDAPVRTVTADGSLAIELEPLGPGTEAMIETPLGTFRGRDHWLRITDLEEAAA